MSDTTNSSEVEAVRSGFQDELMETRRTRRGTPERRRRKTAEPRETCAPECCCVQCSMRTLVRPRYYAGQLLTDDELNSEQAYQIAKDRLHNRYLHGFGVVCGLEVMCDGCDPESVVIRPGYALGPCGEDILVPCPEPLDVIAAIESCKRKVEDCDPFVRRPKDIDDVDEHWCITLAYDEQQVSPKAALRPVASSSCDCSEGRGCRGGATCSCGTRPGCRCGSCTGKNGKQTANGAAHCDAGPHTLYTAGKGLVCEPTRVRESYRLGVVERACATCDTSFAESQLATTGREIGAAAGLMAGRLGTATLLALAIYAFVPYQKLPASYRNPSQATSELRKGKRAVWDLYVDNPLGIPCPDLETVRSIDVKDPEGTSGEFDTGWQVAHQQASLNVLTLVLRYLWEYLCSRLQPPCPPDPCDDRLIIACVTVRDRRVVDVCNFACRKRAGSFTARDHWLSLFGIKPLVLWLLERLCCGDLIKARSPIRNRLADVLDLLDPDGSIRVAVARDDFVRVRRLTADLRALRDEIDLARVASAVRDVVAPDERRDHVAHLDEPFADVARDLDEAGISYTVEDVDRPPLLASVRAASAAGADEVVVLRDRATGRIAGVERRRRTRVEELSAEVRDLRAELATLRGDASQSGEEEDG